MTDIAALFGFSLPVDPLSRAAIQERLLHPKTPEGRPIQWKHPYLVMLAENGHFHATASEEEECAAAFHSALRLYDREHPFQPGHPAASFSGVTDFQAFVIFCRQQGLTFSTLLYESISPYRSEYRGYFQHQPEPAHLQRHPRL